MFGLYLVTFNCARELVDPQALGHALFDALPKDAPVPDLVAISLQEVAPIAYSFLGGSHLKPYFHRVTTSVHVAAHLRSPDGERLEHVATRSLGMTALMLFAKPEFQQRIQWIQSAGAGVGFCNMGNKGAVAMRIGVACPDSDQTLDLSFAAAHLAPSEKNTDARNRDWENLVRNLVFVNHDDSPYSASEERPLLASSAPAPSDHNGLFTPGSHVFFFGDLNYRTHDSSPEPESHKNFPKLEVPESSPAHYSHLLSRDQLNREKEANRTLHGLHELPITFPPTYKYSTSQDSDADSTWAKHRYPSWCDRILFLPSHPAAKLEPQIYTALPVQHTSDHRPVALSLHVQDKPIPRDADEVRSAAPFPLNTDWKARQEAARRWEIMVGAASYAVLTRTGNAGLAAAVGVLLGTWWVLAWLMG